MDHSDARNILNRFTTLPVLLDLLKRKNLVLLDPASWEDKNDSEIILEYKARKGVDKLFALCFSEGEETIHHWKAFADGISGCCIEFNRTALLEAFLNIKGVRHGSVVYKRLRDLKDGVIPLNAIPFTKRWPYRCEDEFRIIWEGNTKMDFYEIAINLHAINKITINQRMPETVYQTIKAHLRDIFDNPDQRINRSTLYENHKWIRKFKRTVGPPKHKL